MKSRDSLIFIIFFGMFIFLIKPSFAYDWNMFGHFPNRTSSSQLPGNINFPFVRWKFNANGPVDSSPAVARLKDKSIIAFGTNVQNGKLYVVDGYGIEYWTHKFNNAVFSSPVIVDLNGDNDPEIIVGTDEGILYVFNYTGQLLWNYEINGTWKSIDSSPLVIWVNNEPLIIFGGFGKPNIYALDKNGNSVWNFTTGSYGVFSSPAFGRINGRNQIILGSYDGNVYSLNPSTGEVLWNYSIGVFVEGTPAVTQNQIFIGTQEGLYSFDGNGNFLWNFSCGPTRGGIAIGDVDDNGEEEIVFGSDDNHLYALKINGSLLWAFETKDKIFSTPFIADINFDGINEVVVGSLDGYLYALKNGELYWKFETDDGIVSSPAFADMDSDGLLEIVIGSRDFYLYVLDRETSEVTVDVFVEFPNGTMFTKTLCVNQDEVGKRILELAGLDINGSYDYAWGFMITCIENVCSPSDWSWYWSFRLIKEDECHWNYMPVGIGPGGTKNPTCWNRDYSSYDGHYCAKNEDAIGLTYRGYGKGAPTTKSDLGIKSFNLSPNPVRKDKNVTGVVEITYGLKNSKFKIGIFVNNQSIEERIIENFSEFPLKLNFTINVTENSNVTFIVDPDNTVEECDESNNEKSIPLNIIYCDDGICNDDETCSSCPQDCGSCPTTTIEYRGGGGIATTTTTTQSTVLTTTTSIQMTTTTVFLSTSTTTGTIPINVTNTQSKPSPLTGFVTFIISPVGIGIIVVIIVLVFFVYLMLPER